MASYSGSVGAQAAAHLTMGAPGLSTDGSSVVDRIMGLSERDRATLLYGPPNTTRTTRYEDEYSADLRTESFVRAYDNQNNPLIRSVISENIDRNTLFPTKLLLPQKPMPESGVEEYQELEFNKHRLDDVPELGVVRHVTSQFRSFKVQYQRKGLGFTMEGGAALTRTGVFMYTMHVTQIANAVQNQMTLAVYFRLLECINNRIGTQQKTWAELFGMRDPQATLRALLEHVCRMWAMLNKLNLAWRQLIMFVREVMGMRNVRPDSLILPANTRAQLALITPEFQDYSKTGSLTEQNLRDYNGYIFTADGMDLFESSMYKMGEMGDVAEDPLIRERMIGEHYVSKYSWHGADDPNYSSQYRDVYAFDNLSNAFKKIAVKEQMRYSGLFDPFTGEITDTFGRAHFGGGSLLDYLNDKDVAAATDVAKRIDAKIKKDPDGAGAAWTEVFNNTSNAGSAAVADQKDVLDPPDPRDRAPTRPTMGNRKGGRFASAGAAWDGEDMGGDVTDLHTSQISIQPKGQLTPTVVTIYHPTLAATSPAENKADFDASVAKDNTNEPIAQALRTYDRSRGFSYEALNTIVDQVSRVSDQQLGESKWVRVLQREFAGYPGDDKNNRVNQIRAYHSYTENGESTILIDSMLRKLYGRNQCSHTIHRMSVYRSYAKRDTHSNEFPYFDARVPSFWDAVVVYGEKGHPDAVTQWRKVVHALNQYLIAARQHKKDEYEKTEFKADGSHLNHAEQLLTALSIGPKDGTEFEQTAVTLTGERADAIAKAIGEVTAVVCSGGNPSTGAADGIIGDLITAATNARAGRAAAVENNAKATPVDKQLAKMRPHARFFKFCVDYDIPLPIDFKMFRPFMEYRMGTVIAMLRGLPTGSCSFGSANFWFGGDVTRKVLMGNFTCRLGAVVRNRDNVFVVPNVVCKGYIRGGGITFYDPLNPSHVRRFMQGDRFADMFCVAMKPKEHNPLAEDFSDITGFFPDDIGLPMDRQEHAHFACHNTFRETWDIQHRPSYLDNDFFDESDVKALGVNTMTGQATQFMPGPGVAPGAIEQRRCCVMGKAHWGPSVYDGVMRDRQGEGDMFVKKVDFSKHLVF